MLHYPLYQSTAFDLLSGDLPKHIKHNFEDQVQRARSLLKDRTPDEVNFVVSSLDWMLERGRNTLLMKGMTEGKIDHRRILNRVKALKTLVDEFDISGQSQFQNATWAEYFSVLTLALVAEMLCQEQSDKTKNFPPHIKAIFNSVDGGVNAFTTTPWAIQTMEAVCYAEQLEREVQLLNETIKEELRARGAKGGKVKSAKYSDLHQNIIALYEEKYSRRTNRGAAKMIYEELKVEVKETLKTDDPLKQIEKVIGRHVNDKRKAS